MSETNMRPLHPDSVGRETKEITRILNEDELNDLRAVYVETAEKLSIAEDEFSEIRKAHNAEKKEMKSSLRSTMRTIKDGQIISAVECDLVPDHVAGIMHYVDPDGNIVWHRRLKPSEKQTRIPDNSEENHSGGIGQAM